MEFPFLKAVAAYAFYYCLRGVDEVERGSRDRSRTRCAQ
jgi:hypothetical protein